MSQKLKLNMDRLPAGAVVICEARGRDSLHVLCAWHQCEYVVWSVGIDGSVSLGSYVRYGQGCFEASSQLEALKRAIEILEERAYGRKGE